MDYSDPNVQFEQYSNDTAFIGPTLSPVFLAIAVIIIVFSIIVSWRIFTKAGEKGWKALIPIYNVYILLKIVGRPAWWLLLFLLSFIPVVGFIVSLAVSLILSIDLAKSFGKSTTFGVVGLWIFSIVGLPILAFGSASYKGPQPTALPTDKHST